MNKGQKQHTVPESYLRCFTDAEGYFYQLDLVRAGVKRVSPGQVCYYPSYYTILDESLEKGFNINDKNFIEKYGFPYERKLSILINMLGKKLPYLQGAELALLVEAYLSLKQRNPKYLQELEDPAKKSKVLDLAISGLVKRLKGNPKFGALGIDFDELGHRVKEAEMGDILSIRKTQQFGLIDSAVRKTGDNNWIFERLQSMSFVILNAPANAYFFVTDNPGCSLKHGVGDQVHIANTNFAEADKVLFPVSSRQCVLFCHPSTLSNYIRAVRRVQYSDADSRLVYEINRCLAAVASTKLFCRDKGYVVDFAKRIVEAPLQKV
jgi:hypothetical protein